jgi:hypothetical protein
MRCNGVYATQPESPSPVNAPDSTLVTAQRRVFRRDESSHDAQLVPFTFLEMQQLSLEECQQPCIQIG